MYTYMHVHTHPDYISLDTAEAICDNGTGYHLLAINSHEEQLILQDFFNEQTDFCHNDVLYIFLGLKMKVVLLCTKTNSNKIVSNFFNMLDLLKQIFLLVYKSCKEYDLILIIIFFYIITNNLFQ